MSKPFIQIEVCDEVAITILVCLTVAWCFWVFFGKKSEESGAGTATRSDND